MANVIKLKRGSGSDPGASDLVVGEIALRTDTGKIFTKKDNGTVAEISGSGGGNNFKINTISQSNGTGGGSATFNGSAYRFTLSDPPGTSCAQCLVSVNGVIQKPVAGTSQPAEGFAISGNDILFSSAPASGADYFIVTYDALSVTEVTDNSIDEGDLKISNAGSNGQFLQKQSGNTGGLTWATVDLSSKLNLTGGTLTGQLIAGGSGGEKIVLTGNDHPFIRFKDSGGTEKGYFQYSGGKFILANQQTGEDLKVGSGSNGLTYGVDSTDNIVWHAGNDGASSGLDSDKLDGQEGSYYLNASNLSSGTIADARLSTATTQSAGNNSTKIATTAYVETAVSNLVDSAPGALNTLNELAAALGDDSNFSANVTNTLATKLNLAGGTITGNVKYNDNVQAQFGASSDLVIYHNGNHSKIRDEGTGNFYLESGDGNIYLRVNDNEQGVTISENGGVELYYDNSKKFETRSDGILVSGHIQLNDSNRLDLGNNGDLRLHHDGSNSVIDNNTGDLYVNSTGGIYLCPKDSEAGVYVRADGAVELYYDNSKKFETTSTGTSISNGNLRVPDANSSDASYGRIQLGTGQDLQIYHDGSHNRIDAVNGNLYLRVNSTENALKATPNGSVEICYDGSKKFETSAAGGSMHGNLYFDDNGRADFGASSDLQIYHNGSHSYIQNGGTGSLYIRSNNVIAFLDESGDEMLAKFIDNGACELYYDNSRKFHTRSDGVNVIGDLDMTDADGYKINLGVSSDLQIYHDGNHSYVEDTGTGELRLASNSGVRITKGDSETQALFTVDGASELYYNNSKKWETVSDGQKTFGHYYADDGNKIQLGTSQDLQLWHDGTDSIIRNLTGETRIQCANIFEVTNYGNTETYIKGSLNGAVELYYDNSKKFQTRTGGAYVYGKGGGTTFAASQAMHAVDRCGFEVQGELTGIKIASTYNDNTHPEYGLVFVQGPSTSSYNCWSISPDGPSKGNGLNFHYGAQSGNIHVNTNCKVTLSGAGHFFPYTNNASDLGTSSKRWRNLYINDLQLSNEGNSNSVDGTWGDWTLQEGEEDIFMINNRSGKKYRMALQEVS